MKSMAAEFKEFITKGNLIDLAIAVVLATFFAPVITAIVDGVILNLVAAIFGEPNFDNVARIKIADGDGEVTIDPDTGLPIDPATYLEFGTVITALITFIIVGFVCFLIVRAYNRLIAEEEEAEEEDEGPSEVDLLTEIRDQLKAQNS